MKTKQNDNNIFSEHASFVKAAQLFESFPSICNMTSFVWFLFSAKMDYDVKQHLVYLHKMLNIETLMLYEYFFLKNYSGFRKILTDAYYDLISRNIFLVTGVNDVIQYIDNRTVVKMSFHGFSNIFLNENSLKESV